MDNLAQLHDLGEARFSGYDGTNSGLDRGLLLLQVFDLFDDQGRVLLGCQTVDAVKEDGAMVIGYQVRFPCLEKLFFETVDHIR